MIVQEHLGSEEGVKYECLETLGSDEIWKSILTWSGDQMATGQVNNWKCFILSGDPEIWTC